jgi:addiction module RelB/DinJ family antitoxin
MNTASLFIKTDPRIKQEAQQTAAELGMSLSAILNAYLRQFVRTKTIHFNAKELGEVPNAKTRAILKKARESRKAGKGSPIFDNAEDAIEWLHK